VEWRQYIDRKAEAHVVVYDPNCEVKKHKALANRDDAKG
jgi:FPC/CPF motif-containing protein YcgG